MTCVLIFEPRGEMRLYACGVSRLSDWYTALANPVHARSHTSLHCASEAVYPLLTWTMTFSCFSAALSLLRPLLSKISLKSAAARGLLFIYADFEMRNRLFRSSMVQHVLLSLLCSGDGHFASVARGSVLLQFSVHHHGGLLASGDASSSD